MSFDQLLVIGVAIGLGLVVLAFVLGRDRSSPRAEVEAEPGDTTSSDDGTTEDAMARLTATVDALKRLAELKNEELARDAEARDEIRTGWEPLPEVPTASTETTEDTDAATAPEETPRPQLAPMITEVSQVRLSPSTKMHPDSAAKLRLSVGQAFTPAAPVARRDLFAGRDEQLETLVDVVFERGQHAIVYGERGVGKTSLATILALVFVDEPVKVPIRVNCDAGDDYHSVWRKVLDELELALGVLALDRPKARAAIERANGKDKLTPSDVTRLLKQLGPEIEAIVIVDEFDSMTDRAPRLFADTIKMLSDQLVPSTLILLGVANTLDELLTEHASISRAVVHLHMPRMSDAELKDIVTRGLEVLTMDIDADALDLIARLSQGFPHFTHLLAQAAARAAVDAQRPLVTIDDVTAAMTKVTARIEGWIDDAYEKATAGEPVYTQVLVAAALAESNERGSFGAADAKVPMTKIVGKAQMPNFARHLNSLCGTERGPVLAKTGDRPARYRFVDAQMEPYAIMRALGNGMIETEALRDPGAAAPAPTTP